MASSASASASGGSSRPASCSNVVEEVVLSVVVEGSTSSLLPVVGDAISTWHVHGGEMSISNHDLGSRMSVDDLDHYSDVLVRNITAMVSVLSNVKC